MSVLKSRWDWLGEVGAIESIKYVYAELYVEILRDSLDLVILEYREIQICDARAIQDIATCIASQVEAFAVAE